METLKVGDNVQHKDGNIGVVVFIHPGKIGERIVEWKQFHNFRCSGESALTIINGKQYRWRKN